MTDEASTTFRDAEAWLAAKGVERRTLVDLSTPDGASDDAPDDGRPDVSATEARRLAAEAPAPPDPGGPPHTGPEGGATVEPAVPLDEAVAMAVATVRRITSGAPASEGRVRRKLEGRDLPAVVVEQAMERARAERLVDDDAFAAALVAEWREKGHAPRRLRDDLRKREFDADTIDRAVAVAEDDDPSAAAFAIAARRAGQLRNVPAETAMRRTAAFLARRGYGEGLARKAARDAVYDQREDDRVTGH